MNDGHGIRRRTLLQLLAGTALEAQLGGAAAAPAAPQGRHVARIGDAAMALEFDERMHCRVISKRGARPAAVTGFGPSEQLRLAGAVQLLDFALSGQAVDTVDGQHGPGVRHRLTGLAHNGIEKTVQLSFFARHPGFAVLKVAYRNQGAQPVAVEAWTNSAHTLKPAGHGQAAFWTFSGASHADRRDWVQPLKAGFFQRNFMGMNASDYGGGTPAADVWHRECGLAVGHLETVPKLVALPVRAVAGGAELAVEYERAVTLLPGEQLSTFDTFLALHTGDYFAALDRYRRVMAERGLQAPDIPAESYQPIWCAWGYERDFTVALMEGTLQKAKDIGLEWAVLDDGWQTSEGDWKIDRKKFPRGEEDMRALVRSVKDAGLKPRLWFTPLAVAPGTDLLHDHTDMLLLDKDGAPQMITWWNSFYLCPAYAKTIDVTKDMVRKILGEWGYQGIKLDGQHLNGVAPCYNPAHHHARPEESVEKLSDFWKAIYDTALEVNPHAVMELCPCGTAYAFHNMPYMNQAPASDPLSSWQVRHKGKTIKALMGPSAPYAGDHVELSDHGDDFASSLGVGAVLSTKFTWPADAQPGRNFVLTPAKEAAWRKWIAIYNDKMLSKGIYRGELYDIGFDKPEAHVIEAGGTLYFAFFATHWSGQLDIRGLSEGSYALRDYVNDVALGQVSAAKNRIVVSFAHALLIEAVRLR
ncbi:glycoside hydrolase family 36 protein [Duganella hordei]|uniref:glycoside hydrolase family 36 protein n=1 Tax=Duganella hordei TaxID=2865934 RepID=UPI0030E984D3